MQEPTDQFVRRATLFKVVDGDTLRLEIDLGFGTQLMHDIRLIGCDTPEPRGPERPAGRYVSEQVRQFFGEQEGPNGAEVVLHSRIFSYGKFGRCLCYVWFAGRCLNSWLLDSGLAWPTDENGVVVGPRNLDRLLLPDAIRRKCLENYA